MERKEVLESIESNDEGIYLDIKVSPNSSSTKITGVNPWRNQLELLVKERAVRGEANRALVKFFADLVDISEKKVKIVRGKTTKSKRMYLEGVDKTRIIDEIERRYEGRR